MDRCRPSSAGGRHPGRAGRAKRVAAAARGSTQTAAPGSTQGLDLHLEATARALVSSAGSPSHALDRAGLAVVVVGDQHGARQRDRGVEGHVPAQGPGKVQDRKSTRLNSSHVAISYAVFCLKKKTKT